MCERERESVRERKRKREIKYERCEVEREGCEIREKEAINNRQRSPVFFSMNPSTMYVTRPA